MKQYVDFMLADKKPRTNIYDVVANSDGTKLGSVRWYNPWRRTEPS